MQIQSGQIVPGPWRPRNRQIAFGSGLMNLRLRVQPVGRVGFRGGYCILYIVYCNVVLYIVYCTKGDDGNHK